MQSGFVQDSADLNHAGLLGRVPTTWGASLASRAPVRYLSFSTVDVSAPTTTSLSPARGAAGVAIGLTSLSISFNENIVLGAGTVSVWRDDRTTEATVASWTRVVEMTIGTDFRVSIVGGHRLTISIDSSVISQPGKTYSVTVDAGSFTPEGSTASITASVLDASGNAFTSVGDGSKSYWTFTSAADVRGPFLISSVPRAGAAVASGGAGNDTSGLLSEIRLTFSERVEFVGLDIDTTLIDGISIRIDRTSSPAVNSSQVSAGGRRLQTTVLATPTVEEVKSWPKLWTAPAPGAGSDSSGASEVGGSSIVLTLPDPATSAIPLFSAPSTRYAVLIESSAVQDSSGNSLEDDTMVYLPTAEKSCS